MKEMKYVVLKVEEEEEKIFIFDKSINHDSFAEVQSYIKVGEGYNWEREFREVISAGFTDGVTCYGASETLGVTARVEDTALLS